MQLKPWMLYMLLGAVIGAVLFWLFEKFAFALIGVGAVGPITTYTKEKIKRAKDISADTDAVLQEVSTGIVHEAERRKDVDNKSALNVEEAKQSSKVSWDSTESAPPPKDLDI